MADGLDVLMGGGQPQAATGLDVLLQGGQIPQAAPQGPKGTGSAVLDTGNAVGTGYWRGMANLAGLPVDTMANVIDLGKAALGAPYIAATGKAPPEWLQVGDRSNVVGSGANLIEAARKTAAGRVMLDTVNPDDQGGTAQTAGMGLTAIMAPSSGKQALNQAISGVASTLGGKAAYDITGNPAYAVAASLTPSAVQQVATAAAKYAARGGEQGRQEMAQRIQDLQNAGVKNPTLGLATGNAVIGGVENILQSTPGAMDTIAQARNDAIQGLRSKVDEAAALASPNRGALESGVAIQTGIRDFKDAFKGQQEQLYNRLGTQLGPQYPTDISNTRQTLANLNADIPGAPALSKFFKNEKIQSLEAAVNADTAGAIPAQPITMGINGQPFLNSATPSSNSLPFDAVKKTRTLVGNELADNSLLSTVPQSKWRALYGGLSQDIGDTANAAGPAAARAFNQANDYTSAGMQRLERVAPFAQTVAPEQAYTALVNASRENVSTLQAVKKTLPDTARGTIAGTIIERLGKATNGVQNDAGTNWSPETFLTNWNKMTPKARTELFSGFPNSAQVMDNVENVAKATSMMRDSSKMWANPSGTGANVVARGLLASVGVGGGAALAGLLNPAVPAGVGAGLVGARGMAGLLTNPELVRAISQRNYVSPQMMYGSQFAPLAAQGLLSLPQ